MSRVITMLAVDITSLGYRQILDKTLVRCERQLFAMRSSDGRNHQKNSLAGDTTIRQRVIQREGRPKALFLTNC